MQYNTTPKTKTPNHRYLVEQALRTSGLPFELRAVIRELVALANWDTGVSNYLIPQRDIAEYLGCGERTLGRYLQQIRKLPGKPWVTWTRTAGPNGLGRGVDMFQVHIGDPVSVEIAKRPTMASRTLAAKSMDPSGQIDGPQRPTLAEPLDHSYQSNQSESPRPLTSSNREEKKKAAKAVRLTPDAVSNPDYLALGRELGLDTQTIITELLKLVDYESGKTRSNWTFRVKQWLMNASVHAKKPANSNYVGSATQHKSVPWSESADGKAKIAKANAELVSDTDLQKLSPKQLQVVRDRYFNGGYPTMRSVLDDIMEQIASKKPIALASGAGKP